MNSSAKSDSAYWPWLLPLGSRNRSHRGGLQFCPECLRRDRYPYFRRLWRIAWMVVCPAHGCLLLERCGTCRRPVEPHKVLALDGAIDRCPHCQSPYGALITHQAEDDVLNFQRKCLDVLSAGKGEIGGEAYSCQQWFEILRCLVIQREPIMLSTTQTVLARQVTGLTFELKDHEERMTRFMHACRAMMAGVEHPALIRAKKDPKPKRKKIPAKSMPDQNMGMRSVEGPVPEKIAKARWALLLRRIGLPME